MADAQNTLQKLKEALTKLSTLLDNPEIKAALGLIPDSIKKPVRDGLKTVLNVVQEALNKLKDNLGAVTTVHQLLGVINDLLAAAEGLAPDQKATLESVKSIVKTLQDLPDAAQITEIVGLITQIITKLEAF